MKYCSIGPSAAGRSGAVAGDYSQKNTFYFGATGGGVWKPSTVAVNWKNISDKYFGGSIGCVTVAPSDPTIPAWAKGKITAGQCERRLRASGVLMMEAAAGVISAEGYAAYHPHHVHPARILISYGWRHTSPSLRSHEERVFSNQLDGGRSWKKVLYA